MSRQEMTEAERKALERISENRPVWERPAPKGLLRKRRALLLRLQRQRYIARGKRGPYLLPEGREALARAMKRQRRASPEVRALEETRFLMICAEIGEVAACERWGLSRSALKSRVARYRQRAEARRVADKGDGT